MSPPKPQDTGRTTIELPDAGRTNGVLTMLNKHYHVVYVEEDDVYRVYDNKQGPAKAAAEANRGP